VGDHAKKFERPAAGVVYWQRMNITEQDDHIGIHGLGLVARVGVPELERAVPQRLAADITLWPQRALSGLEDDLAGTVDYGAAAELCRGLAGAGECRLIETLAERLCAALLEAFPLRGVRVVLKKFILPDTEAVSVSLTRCRDGLSAAAVSTTATP
jgi:dihydroneopterin aldolase